MKKFPKAKIWSIIVICVAILVSIGFTFFKSKGTKAQNNIAVAMAADDNYTYPTIVSITSLLTNSKNDTYYDIYIMIPGNFEEENKQKILSLQRKYENRCKITLIDMQDKYKNANVADHIRTPLSTPSYYRLSLSSLLPEQDSIIWLDGDTLIFDDLSDMFSLNMENLYYRCFLDYPYPMPCFNFKGDHYICAGVMLINLKNLRENNMETEFEKFIAKNNEKLIQHDQTVINVLCNGYIGALPAKYGMFNFTDANMVNDYSNRLIASDRYSEEEIWSAYKNPIILHYVYKPWSKEEVNRKSLWWEYAAKTDYFSEIREKYAI